MTNKMVLIVWKDAHAEEYIDFGDEGEYDD
jgi:hypothetical protein